MHIELCTVFQGMAALQISLHNAGQGLCSAAGQSFQTPPHFNSGVALLLCRICW